MPVPAPINWDRRWCRPKRGLAETPIDGDRPGRGDDEQPFVAGAPALFVGVQVGGRTKGGQENAAKQDERAVSGEVLSSDELVEHGDKGHF